MEETMTGINVEETELNEEEIDTETEEFEETEHSGCSAVVGGLVGGGVALGAYILGKMAVKKARTAIDDFKQRRQEKKDAKADQKETDPTEEKVLEVLGESETADGKQEEPEKKTSRRNRA